MATIDYKEKYEQALERARQFSEKPYLEDSAGIVEYIFPELKESEDEKIRKVLLNDFKNNCSEYYCEGVNRDMIIAWLEKQGEITKEWSEMKINNIQTELQQMVDLKQKTEQGKQKEATCVAEIIDRLSEKEQEILFKELDIQKEHNKFVESIQIGDQVTRNQDGMLVNLSQLKRVAKPSEKQVKQKPYASETMDEKGDFDNGFTRMIGKEYNPSWSNDDEKQLQYTIAVIQWYTGGTDIITWLISLKDRIQPQNTWKPSDEQMEALDDAISSRDIKYDVLSELWKDLKKLKEE